jgi:hypothetical protein
MRDTYWKWVFFMLPLAYCFYYAPFGINETDGGFITGLAWQVLSGKALYTGIIYVRPPIPIWLRVVEMLWLPADYAILGERCLFYLKVAAYCGIGSGLLPSGGRRWFTAVIAFIVSAHCYPAAAWHTTDGLLFATISVYCLFRGNDKFLPIAASVLALLLAAGCKQSFYPLVIAWPVWAYGHLKGSARKQAAWCFAVALAGLLILLFSTDFGQAFRQSTAGAATLTAALQHGLLDFLRIHPLVGAPMVALLFFHFFYPRVVRFTAISLLAWPLLTYAAAIMKQGDFTLPFAQSRLLFLFAAAWGGYCFSCGRWISKAALPFFSLLFISWCGAQSWGYNLPILFALPWTFAFADFLRKRLVQNSLAAQVIPVLLLLLLFRYGYAFIYRDGPRAEMSVHLGSIFPRLSGIYTGVEHAAQYQELKDLSVKYGPNLKTLPAFPLSNYLNDTPPVLPLDWVVKREIGNRRAYLNEKIKNPSILFLVEKKVKNQLSRDRELEIVRSVMEDGEILEETPHFWVIQRKNE